jgi:hypothetical protein
MKWLWTAVLLMLAGVFMPLDNGFSETAAERVYVKMAKAAKLGDTQAVASALHDAENLWPDAPEEYFQVARQVQQVLVGMEESPAAKQYLSNLFESVSAKKKPGNDKKQDVTYFEQKAKTYLGFLELDETRHDKSRLLAIAMFVGEMRANIIPDYENRGTSRPGVEILEQAGVCDARALTEPAQIEAYEKAAKANEEDLLMNELQLTLWRNNRIMTFHLLCNCNRIDGGDSDSKEFMNSVIKNAQLSEKETKKLWPKSR